MKIRLIILLFISALYPMSSTFAQLNQAWKWIHPKPQGNTLRYVKMWDANNWYAIGYNGTFMKTTDAGKSWIFHHHLNGPDENGVPNSVYDAYFFNQDTGIAVGFRGMWRTNDGGTTFQRIPDVTSVVVWSRIVFTDRYTGYALNSWPGYYAMTTDGGNTWAFNMNSPKVPINDIWHPSSHVYVLAGADGKWYKSINGGNSFSSTQITTDASSIVRMKFWDINNGIAIFNSNADGVRRTSDGGNTWSIITTGLPNSFFFQIDMIGDTLYLTGDPYSIYKSTDHGSSWQGINFNAPYAQQPYTLDYLTTSFYGNAFVTVGMHGFMNYVAGADTPVFLTQMKKLGAGLDICTANSGNNLIAVGVPTTLSASDQVLLSTDKGVTWTIPAINNKKSLRQRTVVFYDSVSSVLGSSYSLNSIKMIDNLRGFAVGTSGTVLKTTDAGLSWSTVTTTIPDTEYLACVDFAGTDTGWIFTQNLNPNGTIWKTTNGGDSWTQSRLTGTSGSASKIVSAHMVNKKYGWVLAGNNFVYKTSDGGTSWVRQSLTSSNNLYDIRMIDTLEGYCVGSGRIFKTRSGGASWDSLKFPLSSTGFSMYKVRIIDSKTIIAAGDPATTIISTNNGITWKQYITSAGNTIHGLCVDTSGTMKYAYCCDSYSYIFGMDLSGIHNESDVTPVASENEHTNTPLVINLNENYPNPFNPETEIRYTVSIETDLTLKIYNILGKEVALLVSGRQAPGTYSVKWNAGEYPSGVYLYELAAGSQHLVKKMLLLK